MEIHLIYICTSDKSINEFEGVNEWRKEKAYKEHLKNLAYIRFYKKVLGIQDNEIKEIYIFFLKKTK